MRLKVKKLVNDAKLPERANNRDAGLDVFSNVTTIIPIGATSKIDTGIALEIEPAKDDYNTYSIFVKERSSLGSKGLAKRAGVLDMDYRGHIIICLTNHTGKPYQIIKGDKIAQLVIQKVETPIVVEVDELSDTIRGDKGFGSTGK